MDHPSELSGFSVTWLGQQGEVRVPLADAASTAFEDAPPVRDFPSYQGQRHFPGLYYSVTSDRHVGYESWLERDHAMLLDFDPLITGFASALLAVLDTGTAGPNTRTGLLRPAGRWHRCRRGRTA